MSSCQCVPNPNSKTASVASSRKKFFPVTGFVGSEKDPIPLSDEEAQRILTELVDGRATDNTLGFSVNDNVRIIDGIFENRLAVVKGIDAEKQRLKVLVEDMPVDLDVSQVEKI